LLPFNQDFSEMHIKNGGEFDESGTWVAHDATGWVPRLLNDVGAPEVNDLAALIGGEEDGLADLEISGEEDGLADLEISGEEELEAEDDLAELIVGRDNPLFFVPIGGACPTVFERTDCSCDLEISAEWHWWFEWKQPGDTYGWIGQQSSSGFCDLAPSILHYNWF
jgi:hypothetical protein